MPDPIAFSLGSISIRWYGIILVAGMSAAVFLACREARRQELDADHYFNASLIMLILAILGARAYYVIFNWAYYSANPIKILAFREGGLAIHGGLIVGGLALVLIGKFYRFDPWQTLDIAAPSVALGQAIGRWGNFFNQEAYGYEVSPETLPWAMYIDGAYRHPTFLYESVWDLLLFIFLLWFRRRRHLPAGQVTLMYFTLYSAGRLVIEGFRTDSLMVGSLRVAQVVSAAAIVLSLILMRARRRHNQGGRIINVRGPGDGL